MEDLTRKIVVDKAVTEMLGIQISNIFCYINDNFDLSIHGTIELSKKPLKEEKLTVKADILDYDGRVMYSLRTSETENLLSFYDSISMFCAKVDRFFDPQEIRLIRIYPVFYMRD